MEERRERGNKATTRKKFDKNERNRKRDQLKILGDRKSRWFAMMNRCGLGGEVSGRVTGRKEAREREKGGKGGG